MKNGRKWKTIQPRSTEMKKQRKTSGKYKIYKAQNLKKKKTQKNNTFESV